MKIRNGFISNSSSTSFCIKVSEKFPDVFSLATYMIPYREWTDEDGKLCNKIKRLTQNRNASICFKSCNYETFIVKHGDYYLVDTCNNHDFHLGEYKTYPLPADIEREYPNWDYDSGFGFSHNGEEFWYPESGITAQTLSFSLSSSEQSYCPNCYADYVFSEGKIICFKCLKERTEKKEGKKK